MPADAPEGTSTEMAVLPQLKTEAENPLNVTVEEPWYEPKFVPDIRTDVPTVPDVGDRPEINGKTVKFKVLETIPFTVTKTSWIPATRLIGT